MAHKRSSNVQLLAALADFDDKEESEYRFLVDGRHVKYVTVDPGALPKDDRTFAPVLIETLPPFPPGDWNEGHVSKDRLTGHLVFSRTSHTDLAGVRNIWHHKRIDYLEFKNLDRIRQNIHKVSHPLFEQAVVIKFAEFPWQIPYLEAETVAYSWIEGKEIGPKFLGHVSEAGRVIGFAMENIEGARTAESRDLIMCQDILARLHSLGIKHGDINKHNFLVQDGKAVLVDFETAQICNEKEELRSEYRQLEDSLADPSYRGGVGPFEYHPEWT
ncbi:hypothetical protein F5Y05DRAFT_84860 [Hypoxylon sp. FL0543]|nr:hypothetical protein F5Y05DRAFT_84860 [Hypoxylon sp. FL0543]